MLKTGKISQGVISPSAKSLVWLLTCFTKLTSSRVSNFFLKGPDGNSLNFVDYIVSVATIQLFRCRSFGIIGDFFSGKQP
jgi:hypothetical protein